jgi:hypothetical protein
MENKIVTKSTNARLSGCWTTYLGAAHGVLSAAKMIDMSLPEMSGMTGLAFHFFIHNKCNPGSVTVYDWVNRHQNALERIGVLSKVYHDEPNTPTYEVARQQAVDIIKASIDRGIGVIAWAIDNGEFGIIYGYDDDDGVFMVDGVGKFNRPLGSDPMLYENIAKKFPPAPFLHYQIPLQSVVFEREQAYLESLKYYATLMEKQFHMTPHFHSGFLAYDKWIHALNSTAYNAFGLRYIISVYSETKCLAAQYIRQLADTWDGISGLTDLAECFEEVARLYRLMMVDIMQQDWNGAKHLNKPVSTEQTLQLIPCLERAKKMESDAVFIIKHAIKK